MGITVDELLSMPFLNRTQDGRLRIVADGKPRPVLNMAAAVTMNNNETDGGELRTHQFQISMYDEIQWLTGCEKRHTFFCWPCLLFMPAVGLWNTTGISDLVYFLEGKSKHEETFEHMQAMLQLQDLNELNMKTLKMDIREHNEIVKRNRAILKRMIDVICNLLAKEQPTYERNRGCELDPENCVRNLKFLRSYDVLNCNYIEDAVDLIQISPNIVNDLVNTITRGVKMAIRKEIQQSTYVSVILSDHSKISERSQVSTVLRYLKGGKVCERFIGFLSMGAEKTVPAVYGHILNVLNEFSLSERFLALALDGGLLQPNDVVELNVMLKNAFPFTFFVPWYGHGLDYVLQQSLAIMSECSAFFKAMNELKYFFQKKSKRFKSFETFITGILPATKDTKWFVRSQFLQLVNTYRKYFVQFFESMLQSSTMWEADDISRAMGFLQILEDFNTVFLLQTFAKLFEHTVLLGKLLKSSVPENVFTSMEVKALAASLERMRMKDFENLWSQLHNKHIERPGPASKKVKIDPDDPKAAQYRGLYNAIIDRVIQEIDVRFINLSQLSFCQLLNCDKFGKFVFSNDLLQTLISVHGVFFDEEQIKNELIVLRTNGTVFAKKSVYDILDFFIQAKLRSSFKYLYKLSEFVLTLPIKLPAEIVGRSKFKEIKDWSYIPEATGIQSGDVSVSCVELEFLQELKKSSLFHDEIAVIFYELNKTFELLHR